ncbi:uncharacterized protein LOC123508125 isoform X3 [Portunus trituberculatus]|uniref:uncharacterized protein LOC123508125 isoform X3 n=1 Tax=Portunus trituberculatus TaxID=210409 RepID=UPI001E1CD80A|nr:uncharacterized protein LOC123508125 isoform X3 [Portunus trituberculatus]
MASSMAVARMLGVAYSLTLLCLMSAAQGPNDEVTRLSPQEAFHNVLEIVKAEVRQEIDILNKTRIELFEVSRLIAKPQKDMREVTRWMDASWSRWTQHPRLWLRPLKSSHSISILGATQQSSPIPSTNWNALLVLKPNYHQGRFL